MKLDNYQIEIFRESLNRAKKGKVQRGGFNNKPISRFAIREIEGLFNANEALGDSNLNGDGYSKSAAIIGLSELEIKITPKSRIREKYEELKRKVDAINSNKCDYVSTELMVEIIRLQAAIGIEINRYPTLNMDIIDAIDTAFEEVYIALINSKYEDPYIIVKEKSFL